MDDDGASDQRQKELSISLAASSMINASDMIPEEAYKANLIRIQEVKEMVRRLEMNNETAHKNFLVDQLEKRAKDGREAEIMLTRLRNQPGSSGPVQFTSNVPSDKPEVILPTTATLVEVPESHSSYSSPVPPTTSPLQAIQQDRTVEYNWSHPPQLQPYNSNVFRPYVPPSTVHKPQQGAVSRSQAPVNGQMGWYTTQHMPPQTRAHIPSAHQPGLQPMHAQQPPQSWSSYPPPVILLPNTVPVPGHYTSPSGWTRTAPAHSASNTNSSNMAYREAGLPTQSTASRSSVAAHPQNQTSLGSTVRVQLPLHGVPAPSAKITTGQPPPSRPHPQLAEPQSRAASTTVSKPTTTSKLQQPPELPPQSQPRPTQPQHFPQPPPQFQQQPQPQQPPLQSQHHPQRSQELPSQRPLQLPQTHPQVASQSANRMSSSSISQPHGQSLPVQDSLPINTSSGTSQPPTLIPEQAWQRSAQPRTDQATFIRLFQISVQRGVSQLKAFFHHAKASGVSDEWFRVAINSLPRNVWESVVAQVNQSGLTVDSPSPASVPQRQVSTVPGSKLPVVSGRPSPAAIPLVQTTPIERAAEPSTSVEEEITPPAPGQTSGSYAVQLQYYAEQATKSAQLTSIPTTPSGPTQKTVATPIWDVSQNQVNVRTPKDANKSTLARDILRSLGKIVPKSSHEVGGDKAPEVNSARPFVRMASPQTPEVLPVTNFAYAPPPPTPSAKPNGPAEPQRVSPTNASKNSSAVVEGPAMIDLTLEDSDESVDGKGQEPEPTSTFLIQNCAGAAASSQPASTANTTNHTPLLQNLSLEEPPVDSAAGGDNADVRMRSPSPLPLAAEGSLESELLYPSLGSAESVFEPLPRETSEHPLDGQLPLFLPSPPDSPAHAEPPETGLGMMDEDGKTGNSLKRRSIDVDEAATDIDLLTPPYIRKRRKQQVYVLIPPAPPYVKRARKMTERAMGKDIDSDIEGGEDEEFQYSHLEQLLVEESKSRLSERRCRWLDCTAILNCAANLLAHLRGHVCEEDSQAPFLCHWASCQRQFDAEQERDAHLERHAIRPLPCPFAGCDEQFNKPVEVMQHEVQHQKAERQDSLVHKSMYQPIVPAIPFRLGPPPHRLPSHRVIPRRVVKCRISADRHATMGPWILWNIFSPVDLHTRKQNASMRSRPARQAISCNMDDPDPRRDDYDFLLALSSYLAKNAQPDDLDSTLITMSAARGLTLWGSGPTGNSEAGPTTREEYMNTDAAVPVSAAEESKVGGKSDGMEVASARENSGTEDRQSGQSVVIGEEDAVERMLSGIQEHMY